MRKKTVKVNDKMQKNYHYELTEPVGRNFHPDFKPELTPKKMLALGVFGGKYMTDYKKEFPKSWFQWYCRYYMGRRLPKEDERQIKRWKVIKRHIAQIKKNCKKRDMKCRPKQRQALLHWAYDARKI